MPFTLLNEANPTGAPIVLDGVCVRDDGQATFHVVTELTPAVRVVKSFMRLPLGEPLKTMK